MDMCRPPQLAMRTSLPANQFRGSLTFCVSDGYPALPMWLPVASFWRQRQSTLAESIAQSHRRGLSFAFISRGPRDLRSLFAFVFELREWTGAVSVGCPAQPLAQGRQSHCGAQRFAPRGSACSREAVLLLLALSLDTLQLLQVSKRMPSVHWLCMPPAHVFRHRTLPLSLLAVCTL